MPVQTTTQFSIFLVNKPGVLAQLTGAFATAKINIVAMTLVDSQEHGVMRLVVEKPTLARDVLKKLNLPTTETEVLCLELNNRPGVLADIAGLLGKNHININYAYVSSGAPGGHTTGRAIACAHNPFIFVERFLRDLGFCSMTRGACIHMRLP